MKNNVRRPKKPMPRHVNPGLFIRETVAPLLLSRTVSDPRPVLGIDEGLNDKQHVEPMVRRLLARGIVSMATPLWWQFRVKRDGTRISFLGTPNRVRPLNLDLGRHARGTSCPDEVVVAQLVAYFLNNDRLCLLTQNTKSDLAGLRWILETEVAPVLEELVPKRLGLLALVQKPGSRLEEYCALVERRLTTEEIQAGFRWELLPE